MTKTVYLVLVLVRLWLWLGSGEVGHWGALPVARSGRSDRHFNARFPIPSLTARTLLGFSFPRRLSSLPHPISCHPLTSIQDKTQPSCCPREEKRLTHDDVSPSFSARVRHSIVHEKVSLDLDATTFFSYHPQSSPIAAPSFNCGRPLLR